MATTRTAGTQSKAGGGNAWHRDLAGWKAILSRLRESGAVIDEMQLQQADLEDIFIQIMEKGAL